VILAIGSIHCGKRASTQSPGESASETPRAAALALASTGSTAISSEPPAGIETLMGRLAREARGRRAVSPTAEEVLSALEKLGATIARKQQSLGDTYKANYCLGGYTVDGSFALSACEYDDAGAAETGRDLSKQILSRMPTRDVWSHKADTLAIVQLKADDATTARKNKLVAAFLAM
jgi:hypothetical protein